MFSVAFKVFFHEPSEKPSYCTLHFAIRRFKKFYRPCQIPNPHPDIGFNFLEIRAVRVSKRNATTSAETKQN